MKPAITRISHYRLLWVVSNPAQRINAAIRDRVASAQTATTALTKLFADAELARGLGVQAIR